MGRFVMMKSSRVALVLIVFGTWAAMAGIAKALMQPVYRTGLVALRTATKSKRKSKLSKVVATPWIYTMIFIMMFTAFVGMGILMKDTADYFGFQKHVLSWEYVLHPKYVVLLCACALAGSGAAVATFHKRTASSPVSAAQYDQAWNAGFGAFMGTGAAGFLFVLVLEAARTLPYSSATMPGGEAVSKGIALVLATRSAMKMLSGKTRGAARVVIDGYLAEFGLDGDDADRVKAFAHTLPNRMDDSAKSVEQRMIARGFDAGTARATAGEVRTMRARAADAISASERASAEPLASVIDGASLARDDARDIREHLSRTSASPQTSPGVKSSLSAILGILRGR